MGVICNDWRFGRRRIASPIKPALGGGVRGSNSCHGKLPEGICIVQAGAKPSKPERPKPSINLRICIL